MQKTKLLEVKTEDLPIVLKLVEKNQSTEYILKSTKNKTGIFLNKKEQI